MASGPNELVLGSLFLTPMLLSKTWTSLIDVNVGKMIFFSLLLLYMNLLWNDWDVQSSIYPLDEKINILFFVYFLLLQIKSDHYSGIQPLKIDF